MTVWHYKGERISREEDEARYRFYPDHVMAPEVYGVFTVNIVTWEYRIDVAARTEKKGLVSLDERCVSALVHKLEKVSPEVPEEVFFIA